MFKIVVAEQFNPLAGEIHSFLSPVNYLKLKDTTGIVFHCDGILAAYCISRVIGRRIRRTSFDFGSVALPYLEARAQAGDHVLFVGGRPAELAAFSENIRRACPQLQFDTVSGYPDDGKFSDGWVGDLLTRTQGRNGASVILALGAPLQEQVALRLKAAGFGGAIVTAGAFMSQTANSDAGRYYPIWVNRFHLRSFWRLAKEPHTRKRFPLVFLFPFIFAFDLLCGRTRIEVFHRAP